MASKATKNLRFRVSANLFHYLEILKNETVLGASENDIAEYLLTRRLEEMIAEKYHENQSLKPKTDKP